MPREGRSSDKAYTNIFAGHVIELAFKFNDDSMLSSGQEKLLRKTRFDKAGESHKSWPVVTFFK